MLKKFFAPGEIPISASLGLFTLRLWLGLTLLLNHGLGKLQKFSSMSHDFADPFGIGPAASLALVLFAEVVASALLALGLVTRFAAFVLAFNMVVAFLYAHKGSLSGSHSGELAFIYLASYVALFLTGPGQIALDKKLFGKQIKAPKPKK